MKEAVLPEPLQINSIRCWHKDSLSRRNFLALPTLSRHEPLRTSAIEVCN